MTENARDKAPQTADTTAPADTPPPASAAKPSAAKPAAAEPAGAGPAGAGPAGDGAKPDLDEVKRKFRAALDAKHEVHSEGSSGGGRDAGRIHGARGAAGGRRTFRRKSG